MENQNTPQNTAGGSVCTGDLFGSLIWLVETFRTEIAPFSASTDLNHPQSSQWRCHGCEGFFTSHWPTWTEPTDETFPHEQHCKYMKAVRLTQAKTNTADDAPAFRAPVSGCLEKPRPVEQLRQSPRINSLP